MGNSGGDSVQGFRLVPGRPDLSVAPLGCRQNVDVVDISKGKVIARRRRIVLVADLWWQSENEVGYLDENGGRHLIVITAK